VSASRLLLATVLAALLLGLACTAAAGNRSSPPFQGRIEPISARLQARMTSWHRGCPIRVGELRLLTLSHWGFDRRIHEGELVVTRHEAKSVLRVMRAVFVARFPIRRMRLVEAYGSNDDRSMAADNTSAFNCRLVEHSDSWSEHAYGRAIDINPLENPYILGSEVSPPAGAAFRGRSRWKKGMIHGGDAVVRAFASIGWCWGGYWHSPKDYQHFSATGR
jgi:hypothetical protein